jgi:hypothetical protein
MQSILIWLRAAILRAGWAPIAVFAIHVVISRGLGAYLALPGLDVPMHILGGVAIAHFFRLGTAVPEATPVLGNLSRSGRTILCAALVAAAALVWELLEWTGDALGYTSAQVDLDDTMLDMLLGLAGGALYLGLIELRRPVT